MAGIQETLDVIRLGVGIGNALGKALNDGKLSIMDLRYATGLLSKIPAAINGFENVPEELKDLDESEKEEIFKVIQEEFDIPQDNLEPIIEEGFKVAVTIIVFIKNHFIK